MRVVKSRVLKRAQRAQRAAWVKVNRFALAAVVALSGLGVMIAPAGTYALADTLPVSLVSRTTNSITLNFTVNESNTLGGIECFDVQADAHTTLPANEQSICLGVGTTSITFNNVSAYLQVDEMLLDGSYSAWQTFDVAPAVMTAPTNLQMMKGSSVLPTGVMPHTVYTQSLLLNWSPVAGANHYIETVMLNGQPVGAPTWTGYHNVMVAHAGFGQYGNGSYTVRVCAYGSTSAPACATSGAYIYDTMAPQNVTITPHAGAFVSGATTWKVTDTDVNPSYIYVELNHNGDWITDNTKNGTKGATQSTLTYDTAQLANGTYTIKVDAVDQAGNTTQETYNYTVYNTTPTITARVMSGKSTSTTDLAGTSTFAMTLNNDLYPSVYNVRLLEANGVTPVQVNGKSVGGYATNDRSDSYLYRFNTAQVPDGTYVVQFSARDQAGNTAKTVFEKVVIDNTAPVVTYTSTTYATPTPIITGTVNDPAAVVRVMVNGITGTATNNGNGTWSYTVPASDGLVNGQAYPISVTATSTSGNVSTPATGSVTVSPLVSPTSNLSVTPSLTVVHAALHPPVSNATTNGVSAGTTTSTSKNAGVLGDSTSTPNASTAAVKGDSTVKDTASAVSHKAGAWWLWWLIILLVVIGIVWWIIAAFRRRKNAAQ